MSEQSRLSTRVMSKVLLVAMLLQALVPTTLQVEAGISPLPESRITLDLAASREAGSQNGLVTDGSSAAQRGEIRTIRPAQTTSAANWEPIPESSYVGESSQNIGRSRYAVVQSSGTLHRTIPGSAIGSDMEILETNVAPPVSTFDTDTEGWTVEGNGDDSGPEYFAEGGNPGGYIRVSDSVSGAWYFVAPDKFQGDFLSAYGRELLYELKYFNVDPNQSPPDDVELEGGGLTLRFDTATPGREWTLYQIPLHESAGWWIETDGSPPPTREQMLQVLGDVTRLRIRGEYYGVVTGSDQCGLDNVRLGGSAFSSDHGYSSDECPFCGNGERQNYVGGPINTYSGNYSYQATDLSIPTLGQPLRFERTYNSLPVSGTVVYSRPLGYGWTHNLDIQLVFSDTNGSGSEPDTVILKAPHGSRMRFSDDGEGGYEPYPGVWATLTRTLVLSDVYTYTVTTANQERFVFSDSGRLSDHFDALGHRTIFSYTDGITLSRVIGPSPNGERWLAFDYDSEGRIRSVTDHTNRTVSYGYDGNGDLMVVTDTLGYAWTYVYSGTTHLLHEVVEPGPNGRVIERTFFDDQGRAKGQENGLAQAVVEIDYGAANTRVVTETGKTITDSYNVLNVLAGQTDALGNSSDYQSDLFFNRSGTRDANGNETAFGRTQFGLVTSVTDAQGNVTGITYDSYNSPTRTVQAAGTSLAVTTTYAYTDTRFPTFMTAMTDGLANPWEYRANEQGLPAVETDPLGNVTRSGYDAYGQVTTMTVEGPDSSVVMTTTFGYDDLGRQVTVTRWLDGEPVVDVTRYDPAGRPVTTTQNYVSGACGGSTPDQDICTVSGYDVAGRLITTTRFLNGVALYDVNQYDAAGRLVATIRNYRDGVFSPLAPDEDVVTGYGYDDYGRQILVTDTLDIATRTFYDALGRVEATVENYDGSPREELCLFADPDPEINLCTRYEYDAVGNTVIVTDSLGHMARTFYDELNRVKGTIVNWTGSITTTAGLGDCYPPLASDRDLCTVYQYDALGNTIVVTDSLGHTTRTFYDALGRVEARVANWNSSTLTSPDDCVFSPVNTADENLCTTYGYDAAGKQITTTNPAGQTALTVYDAAGRPTVTVENWDGVTAIDGPEDCDYSDPHATDNLCTVTTYDSLGRRAGTTDPLGNDTDYAYDGLGRVITTTRYLDGALPVRTAASYDGLGNRLSQTDAEDHTVTYSYDSLSRLKTTTGEEGVTITQTYDALGRVTATTDELGHTAIYTYSDAGRLVATADAEGNVTRYAYDALGSRTAITDANGIVTEYGYDWAGRLASVTENVTATLPVPDPDSYNVVTRYGYDALGHLVVVTDALTHETNYDYDGLGRQTTATDPLGHQTSYAYNPLGARLVLTDANGVTTDYAYDALNRLSTIQYPTATVTFTYDSVGNRTAMTDSVGTTRTWYDTLYRPITVTDPFTGTVAYRYDKAGNRTGLIYPGGGVVTYTYDGDNRLMTVEDWDAGLTTYGYDAAGRLVTETLPNGVVTVHEYDSANRLTGLEHTGSAGLLARYDYELDGVGNRIQAVELVRPAGGSGALGMDAVVPSGADYAAVATGAPSGPEGGGPRVWLQLERNRLTADGRDGTRLLVLVTGDDGRPVADGTLVTLSAEGGSVSPSEAQTSGGLVFAWLRAGDLARPGRVTAEAAGGISEASFGLTARGSGEERIDAGAPPAEAPLPFDLLEVVERARNTIQGRDGAPPILHRPWQVALFDRGALRFAPSLREPLPGEGEGAPLALPGIPLTATVQLARIAVGETPLFEGPQRADVQLDGNIARMVRGEGLVEEFVARDGGIEHRWRIENDPGLAGDLVIAVEVESALEMALDERGEGFVFRAVHPRTGWMVEVASYGRALAVDADGRAKRALLGAQELEPTRPGLHRYRIEMAFAAEWLAGVRYPLLVDPLIGNLLRLDAAQTQAGSQEKPAVAYNSVADEYLVVWESDLTGNDDVYGQLISGDGLLVGQNFRVAVSAAAEMVPDVAYNADADSYLAVWRQGTSTIKGQVIRATGELSGTQLTIALSMSGSSLHNPAVAYSASAGRWLVAWQTWNGLTEHDIDARAVDAGGGMGTAFAAQSAADDDVTPDVAANGNEGYLVTWARENAMAGSFDVYARRVTTTSVDGAAFYVDGRGVSPAVAYDGDDDQYLVAWQTQATYNAMTYDAIRGRRVLGNKEGEQEFDGNAFTISDAGQLDCALPGVTYFAQQGEDGGAYLVGWQQQEEALGTGPRTDLMMRAVLATGEFGGDPAVLCSAEENQADVALGFGPAITATLAAWTDERAGNPDVRARLVERDGSLGPDTLVHPAPGDQQKPQVAYNPDDDEYLVVWRDYRKGTEDPDIYGQRVSGDGTLVGENFTVTNRSYRQIDPYVAYAADGQVYLVAWRDYPGASSDYYDAYGQLISRTGVLIGSPITISARSGLSDRESPTDIVYNSMSDEFLVLWSDLRSGYWSVYGKHVSITGTVGSEIQITFEDLKGEDQARGAYNPDDDQYLVVYTYRDSPGGPGDVLGRRMTGSGTVTTTDTIEIAAGGPDQQNADVAFLPGLGRYVAVWQDDGSGNADIYGRLVSPQGTLDGSSYTIASESQDETLPRLSANGGWPLVVWQRANTGGTGEDLYGRTLWTDGRPADDDPAFTLVEAAGNQESAAVAGDGSGRYLVAWQDDRNGDWDIYGVPVQPERVIDYQYDGLYRLTEASYSTGERFQYDYDPVGNREAMTVTTPLSGTQVTTYTYDAANRLTYVGGVALTWDNNGNLLEDHEGTDYAYDSASRLTRVVQDGVTYTFSYNATGDRLAQSVGGEVTTYTLDLYGGLTQMLGDGASVYLYGLGRIGEEGAAGWLYPLGDALGSVRQLAAGDGEVVLDRSYRPYGGVLESGGSGGSAYGFAGEWTDGTGLAFLRARYMDLFTGRFLTQDPWEGIQQQPRTRNGYVYVLNDPINRIDPSGLICIFGLGNCDEEPDLVAELFRAIPIPDDFCLPGNLGCWGGGEYADWLENEYYPNLPFYLRYDVGYVIGPELPTDRTGIYSDPSVQYDITSWLVYEMRSNARGPLAETLREYYPCPGSWLGWYNLVRGGGIWDFKSDIRRRVGDNIILAGDWFYYDVPANIHFGYLGRAIGFSWQDLVGFAGLAQFRQHAVYPFLEAFGETHSLREGWNAVHWENIGPWECNLDECPDLAAITVGMELYEQYGYDINEQRLQEVLREYEDQLRSGTPQH